MSLLGRSRGTPCHVPANERAKATSMPSHPETA
jgi:hypothetical protein